MDRYYRKLALAGVLIGSLPFVCGSTLFAAKPIDLSHQKPNVLQRFLTTPAGNNGINIQELNRSIDFNKTLHIRIQETYNGYPVWGGDAVVHVPQGGVQLSRAGLGALSSNNSMTMNGVFYDGLSADLANIPASVFTDVQAQKALQHVILTYQQKVGGKPKIVDEKSKLMVYIDKNKKAHWAYQVSFTAASLKAREIPEQPIYILDAVSFHVYDEWNDMKTLDRNAAFGGGYGGNERMGKVVYDGLQGNLGKLNIKRDEQGKCYFQNQEVLVKKCTMFFLNWCFQNEESVTQCAATDPNHNNVYWNGEEDAINGGYSPTNDALFNGSIIKSMYKTWYDLPVLKNDDGSDMLLTMIVHLEFDNAYWDGRTMNFGDGVTMFYPLTSLGVAAHEISHGFTTQHSNLAGQTTESAGMNEAFSDIAAQAAEYFAYGKNSWQIGPEIFKESGKALRYMDKPSKDCPTGTKPGPNARCSCDDYTQYADGINMHYSSGIYNRFFYTLATTEGWDVKKAFDIMVQANAHYWTANITFAKAACDVIKSAQDYGYDVNAVKAAFDVVKVKYKNEC
jgi:pseudolysin